MSFAIKCQFRIESARHLTGLPADHPCSSIHGHGFDIWITLVGPLKQPEGWVEDYHLVESTLNREIFSKLDHRLLNEIEGLSNPTTEVLCEWIYNRSVKFFPNTFQVEISETPKSVCVYPHPQHFLNSHVTTR